MRYPIMRKSALVADERVTRGAESVGGRRINFR